MNRRLPAPALAAALAAVAMTTALAALPTARAAVAGRIQPTATPPSATTRSGCRVETARDVDAERTGLTGTVGVTLTIRGCLERVAVAHFAFVLDTDLGDERDTRAVHDAIGQLVAKFDLPSHPTTKVAVVGFGAAARLLTPLTNDAHRINGAVSRARGPKGGAIDLGIDAARRELARGRRGLDEGSAREVLILFSSGDRDRIPCGKAIAAAGRAKGEGILVISVITRRGKSADVQCMRQIATVPRYFFEVNQIAQIVHIFDAIRTQFDGRAGPPVGIVITDTIAPAFDIDRTSIHPPLALTTSDGRLLRWQLPTTMTFPVSAVTVTYRLHPRALGLWPVSLGATAAFTDWRANRGTIAFPPASVQVVDPASADARVCPATRAAVPADVIAAALASPERVAGWALRCSESQPAGPANPLRRSLRLARPGMAYHPLANGLVWACGCR